MTVSRQEWFSRVSSSLARHVRAKHPEIKIKRIQKGGIFFYDQRTGDYVMAENIYRCLKCNRVYAGFLWALVHYIGKHLISDEELERMYKKFFGDGQ